MISKNIANSVLLTLSVMAVVLLNPSALADSHLNQSDMENGDHHHGDSHGKSMEQASVSQSVMGLGVINKVVPEARMVSITHEPMEALNWPEMRMNFKVDEKVDLSVLEAGQQVEFMLDVMDDNNYLVTEIKVR